MRLQLVPLSEAIGVEVRGVDLQEPLDGETFDAIRQALAEHSLLLFRGQDISPEAQIAFSRRFGTLEEHVLSQFNLPGFSEIYVVSNIVENGRHIGAHGGSKEFHSDLAYMAEPSFGSVFRCVECPEEGGETAFASMFAAHDALPEDLRRRVENLRAVYDYVWSYERRHLARRGPLTPEQKAKTPPVVQPAVRVHPETGRKALFVSDIWVRRFEGMEEAESQRLARELVAFATQPAFVYTHRWQPHDILVWDNRSSMHKACPFDEENSRRLMYRTTVKGDRPIAAG